MQGKRDVVSQSSIIDEDDFQTPSKAILLQRDCELAEFLAVLTELEVQVVNCLSGLPARNELPTARLVIASAERLLESGPPHLSNWPRTFAVIQNPSRTLSAHLVRIGVTMILRRPIHPRTLRLLLLHEFYRGPEKRGGGRTLLGQPVRIGSRLFGSKGMLIDLSPTSARLQLAKAPKLASTLPIQLGRELTQGPPLKLKARVIRCSQLHGKRGYEVGVAILDADSNRKAIQSIVHRFGSGPAPWKSEPSNRQSAVRAAAATDSPDPTPRPQVEPEKAPAPRTPPPACTPAASQDTKVGALPARFEDTHESLESDADQIQTQDIEHTERRSQQRIPYERRVVALDEEAARVLVGRELSMGGMRIVSNASVPIGSLLRIALHSGPEMEPLILMTRAVRDDGPAGTGLVFENLDPSQREHLEKIIAGNGQIRETGDPDTAESEVDDFLVIGELLDEIDLVDAIEIEDADSFFDTDESIEDIL